MSCVCSELFNHKDSQGVRKQLKPYAHDDKFYLRMEQHSVCGETQYIIMNFSVDEARVIQKQLEEFIALNKGDCLNGT